MTRILYIISIIISFICLCYAIYNEIKFKKYAKLVRINQVTLSSKTNRVYSGDGTIQYNLVVSNGSNLIISNVFLYAPEDIVKTLNNKFKMDKKSRLRIIEIGQVALGERREISFKMKNSNKECYLTFKDINGKKWVVYNKKVYKCY